MRKRGFTLVELSIVLVIVGLLIGGILVGQSLVDSARINSFIQQIHGYDVQIALYKDKYNCLASDCATAIPGNYGGNGDGLITKGSFWQNQVGMFGGEIGNFWAHLEPETYSPVSAHPSYTSPDYGAPAVTSGSYKNSPLSKLGKKGSFIVVSAIAMPENFTIDPATSGNYYGIFDPTEAQITGGYNNFDLTTSTNSAVSPADALALDKKMDDGIANTGFVISANGHIYPNRALATCSSGALYVTTNKGYECTPLIKLGSQGSDIR